MLRRVLSSLIYRTGALGLANRFVNRWRARRDGEGRLVAPFVSRRRRRNLQILIYHRVNDLHDPFFGGLETESFRAQMRFLRRHFNVVGLDDGFRMLAGDSLPANAVAITFDDGYRDNFTNAFPILREFELPATIFLATDVIGTGRVLWHDLVFNAFRVTTKRTLSFDAAGLRDAPLEPVSARVATQMKLLPYLRTLDSAARMRRIEELYGALDLEFVDDGSELMLDWDCVKEMAAGGISFGAHTCSHPILSPLSADDARREIAGSREAIESRLGKTVESFAYPNGTRRDFSEETKSILREVGFTYAVTTVFGTNDSADEPYELKRGGPWEPTESEFGLKMNWYKFAS